MFLNYFSSNALMKTAPSGADESNWRAAFLQIPGYETEAR